MLRGGCYGQCELAPNLVVRRYAEASERPDVSTDRLSLTRQENETVYALLDPSSDDVARIVRAHLVLDRTEASLTQAEKEITLDDDDSVAGRIRNLRRQRTEP